MLPKQKKTSIASRFRGLMPVVIDLETGGLNPSQDALLEIAIVFLGWDAKGHFYPARTLFFHVEPFLGAGLDPEALAITGIDPFQPLRFAIPEKEALHQIFLAIEEELKKTSCQRAIWVGHNVWFDLAFMQAAVKRSGFQSVPYHSFTTLDTATLSAVMLGETVLARGARAAKIPFNVNEAHSAIYDAEKTAALFCWLVNR